MSLITPTVLIGIALSVVGASASADDVEGEVKIQIGRKWLEERLRAAVPDHQPVPDTKLGDRMDVRLLGVDFWTNLILKDIVLDVPDNRITLTFPGQDVLRVTAVADLNARLFYDYQHQVLFKVEKRTGVRKVGARLAVACEFRLRVERGDGGRCTLGLTPIKEHCTADVSALSLEKADAVLKPFGGLIAERLANPPVRALFTTHVARAHNVDLAEKVPPALAELLRDISIEFVPDAVKIVLRN